MPCWILGIDVSNLRSTIFLEEYAGCSDPERDQDARTTHEPTRPPAREDSGSTDFRSNGIARDPGPDPDPHRHANALNPCGESNAHPDRGTTEPKRYYYA